VTLAEDVNAHCSVRHGEHQSPRAARSRVIIGLTAEAGSPSSTDNFLPSGMNPFHSHDAFTSGESFQFHNHPPKNGSEGRQLCPKAANSFRPPPTLAMFGILRQDWLLPRHPMLVSSSKSMALADCPPDGKSTRPPNSIAI